MVKTVKTLKKRVKKTPNNKIKRKKAFGSHLLSKYNRNARVRKKKMRVEHMNESALSKFLKKLGI